LELAESSMKIARILGEGMQQMWLFFGRRTRL
jgi:hypothetical protein